MQLHAIGIDLGKTVFHLVGLNPRGEVHCASGAPALSSCSSQRTSKPI